ncbi:MAG UNVERIFIED_CONTAM: hypothetical protein LVQ98_02255 [Rickettsiaceae bacterium]|jgi:tetratricopeptide (TPR) repeat protein
MTQTRFTLQTTGAAKLKAGNDHFTATKYLEALTAYGEAKDLFTQALALPADASDDPRLEDTIKKNLGKCYNNLGATYIEFATTDPANQRGNPEGCNNDSKKGNVAGYMAEVKANLDIAHNNLKAFYAEALSTHCKTLVADPSNMTNIDAALAYLQGLDLEVLKGNAQNSNVVLAFAAQVKLIAEEDITDILDLYKNVNNVANAGTLVGKLIDAVWDLNTQGHSLDAAPMLLGIRKLGIGNEEDLLTFSMHIQKTVWQIRFQKPVMYGI